MSGQTHMREMATHHPRALGKVEYEALATFRHEVRRFLAFSAASAETAGLTPRQHQALLAIKGFPEAKAVSVGQLAEQLLIRHHSATELADRLCEAGLLVRAIDPLDRRRVLLSLTPVAEDILRRLSDAHLTELGAMRPALAALLDALSRTG